MVTTLTVEPIAGDAWRLDFASDLPEATFYVYRDGVLVTTTRLSSLVVGVAEGESPVFEVLDDPEAAPSPTYPDYALLAWYASPGAAEYRVEELLAGVWTVRTVLPDGGEGYFTWRSGPLADSTTHQFRVTPIGTNGNAGDVKQFVMLMVKIPDPPAVTYAYSAGTGAVTIAAA